MNPQVEAANDNNSPQTEGGELLADAEARINTPVEAEVTKEVNKWAGIINNLEAKRDALKTANDNSVSLQEAV